MLSPTEIYDNVEALVARRPNRADFGLELMDAVGAPRATITKLRIEAGGSGSFTWTRMLHFTLVDKGATVPTLEAMRAEEALWVVATVGWLFMGYHVLASTRTNDIAPFWRSPFAKVGGLMITIPATIWAFFVAQWWWGVVVFLTAPNLAALVIILLTPKDD